MLLDTHIFLWWLADDQRLPSGWQDKLKNGRNLVYVSAVSIWELAIKKSIGKLTIKTQIDLSDLIHESGFAELPVSARHAAGVESLSLHHADPFDRLLIAQAQIETLSIMTMDAVFRDYDVALVSQL